MFDFVLTRKTGLDHEMIVTGMSALVGGSYDAIVDWLLLHVRNKRGEMFA